MCVHMSEGGCRRVDVGGWMSESGCGTVDVGGLINVWEGMGGV